MNPNRATPRDLPEILSLLRKYNLSVQGVSEHLKNFLVLKAEGKMLGCIGLEIYRRNGLLRSLAVIAEEQGRGHGRLLVHEVLNLAKKKNLRNVYLRTIDGKDYFRRFNFQVIERDKVDSEIQKSLAFNSQCCYSAICMFKTIN
jgi:N-acetylglutamate synthase-like GNAT family acetyltransferase